MYCLNDNVLSRTRQHVTKVALQINWRVYWDIVGHVENIDNYFNLLN